VTGQSLESRQQRWREEQSFFDQTAAEIDLAAMDPLALRRYAGPLRRRFSKEFRLRLLGDLRGKKLLDVGCGEGSNGVLLAKLGAEVTGIDISPRSIQVARQRAEINQVAAQCRFICSPLETAELANDSFDLIWGDGILHHVLPDLPAVLGRLAHWAKPEALLVFGEPINLNPTLRRIRFLVPVKTEATPGERPLEGGEIALVRRYIPDLRMRHFGLLGRLDRFVLVKYNYERSNWGRRAVSNCGAMLDWAALAVPGLRRLGGSVVLFGHPAKG
jgi:2-polyprenyl-3-methyl-5-hydroxy-6-metoxy-1,4-benzoquinol methylase